MALQPEPRKNRLLDALPDAEWQRWLPQLEAVEMPLGQVLYESGTTLSHVYFPTTAIALPYRRCPARRLAKRREDLMPTPDNRQG